MPRRMRNGLDRAFGPERMDSATRETASLAARMERAMARCVETADNEFGLASTALRGLDPEAPLERGYSLVRVERTGAFLRDPKEVTSGDALDIRVKNGRVAAVVKSDSPDTQE